MCASALPHDLSRRMLHFLMFPPIEIPTHVPGKVVTQAYQERSWEYISSLLTPLALPQDVELWNHAKRTVPPLPVCTSLPTTTIVDKKVQHWNHRKRTVPPPSMCILVYWLHSMGAKASVHNQLCVYMLPCSSRASELRDARTSSSACQCLHTITSTSTHPRSSICMYTCVHVHVEPRNTAMRTSVAHEYL